MEFPSPLRFDAQLTGDEQQLPENAAPLDEPVGFGGVPKRKDAVDHGPERSGEDEPQHFEQFSLAFPIVEPMISSWR